MPFKAIAHRRQGGDGEVHHEGHRSSSFVATHTGMTVDAFQPIVKDWIAKAKHPRFDRPYPQMVYQPMLEVMKYLRDNGYEPTL